MANLFDTPIVKQTGNLFDISLTKKLDLSTIEGLQSQAEKAGLGSQAESIVNAPEKLSFLQRLGKG